MNKEDFKDIKLFIGPMTKNVVDSTIDFCEKFNVKLGFIPSRRQIEFDSSGYVNNWTTRTFKNYIKDRTDKISIIRDHGGPNQGLDEDDGFASMFQDCNHFDVVHVDVWKKYKDFEMGLNKTVEYIKYCNSINDKILFEVGTEEGIRKTTTLELDYLMQDLSEKLPENIFNKIIYLVIQDGTALKESNNIGSYDNVKLKEMLKICNKYGILSKTHNGDYLNVEDIHDRYDNGLNAINIAPEFGQIETNAILSVIGNDTYTFNKFYDICFNSGRWKKWVGESFVPENNKTELIKICGHYVISNPDTEKITHYFKKKISDIVKEEMFKKLSKILKV
jgi:D-tagatose-1,6-bisphosphate aldolase subunit GatZ/KbaZ